MVLSSTIAMVVERVIRMWLLWLADLDVPSRSLTCAVTPPHPVLRVSIRLASRQINATLYRIFFSSMLG